VSEQHIDKELISQVLKGDNEAFDVLVLKYQHKVAKIVSHYVDEREVSDITQDTFIKAFNALPSVIEINVLAV